MNYPSDRDVRKALEDLPTSEDIREALAVLEKVLATPTTRESDTRVKRRIRVEIRRLLSAESAGD